MLALVLAAAVAAVAPLASQAQTKAKIGSSVRSIFSLPLYVADQKGYFKEQGIDAEISFFTGGPPATAALLGGSVDFIAASLENQLKVNKKGEAVVSIANMQSDFSGALTVREEVAKKLGRKPTVKDMKGLKIGTLSRGGFADMAARYVLISAGLDPEKDADIVPIRGFDKVIAAGEQDAVQAALFVEPWQTIGVEGGRGWTYVVEMTRGEGPDVFKDMGYVTLQTTNAYLEKNRDVAEKVVRAVVKAQRYIRDDRNLDELVKIALVVFPNSDQSVLRASIRKQEGTFRPALKQYMIDKNMDLLTKNGVLSPPAPTAAQAFATGFEKIWAEY
jgi:NitT/TauT family transport system substrate-binding protein